MRLFAYSLSFSVMLSIATNAEAGLIRVAQESSFLAGDFEDNVLGFINPFQTTETAADYYDFSSGQFNGVAPTLQNNTAHLFLVNASDGLSLFHVLDAPNSPIGGRADTVVRILRDTAAFQVQDDLGDFYTTEFGGRRFTANNLWAAPNTDGYAIGSLDHHWEARVRFAFPPPVGLARWHVISSDGSEISVDISRRRVQLLMVPEPSTVALAGIGLLGGTLGLAIRRRFVK